MEVYYPRLSGTFHISRYGVMIRLPTVLPDMYMILVYPERYPKFKYYFWAPPLLVEFYCTVTSTGDHFGRSAIVADRPLSPATRRRLGGLLPRQLADRTQAHLKAHCCFDLSITLEITSPFGKLCPTLR